MGLSILLDFAFNHNLVFEEIVQMTKKIRIIDGELAVGMSHYAFIIEEQINQLFVSDTEREGDTMGVPSNPSNKLPPKKERFLNRKNFKTNKEMII